MDTKSPDFTENTKKILSKMASERCCICEELTSKPNSSNTSYVRIGEAAHISGAREKENLRFDKSISNIQRQHYSNGIWLCSNCHTKVDQDQIKFSVEKLIEIRDQHYQRIKNGKYDKSSFIEVDELNSKIYLLNNAILDKEKLLKQSEKIYDLEIIQLKIEIEKISNDRDKLWKDYMSILENINQNDSFEIIFRLVFEENDLNTALQYLTDSSLQNQESDLVKKYLLKADIYKLQNKQEAAEYYKKAYHLQNSYKVAIYYIRYLDDIRDFSTLIEFISLVLKSDLNFENEIILRGKLGMIYSKTNPELAIHEFKIIVNLIEKEYFGSEKYYYYKASYLNYLAIAYKNKNDLDKAIEICEESLSIFISGKIEANRLSDAFSELFSLYNTIALIYAQNLNYDEAIKYYHLALKIANEQIEDNCKIKAIVLINYSQIYSSQERKDTKKAIEMIDEAIFLINKLYVDKPLEYVELLITSYFKKSDYSILELNFKNFNIEITKAENLVNQFINLNYKGFDIFLAEISSRKALFYFLQKDKENANIEIEKALLLYEDSNFTNEESVTKTILMLIFKTDLTDDIEAQKALLIKAKKILEPLINNFSSTILLNQRIDNLLKKYSN